MITLSLSERAGYALSQELTGEDRVNGRIFRFRLVNGTAVELSKEVPAADDHQFEHDGAPVLAVPTEITLALDSLDIDVTAAPDGESMSLVVKFGKRA